MSCSLRTLNGICGSGSGTCVNVVQNCCDCSGDSGISGTAPELAYFRTSTDISSTPTAEVGTNQILYIDGTLAAPAFAFKTATQTGIYNGATGLAVAEVGACADQRHGAAVHRFGINGGAGGGGSIRTWSRHSSVRRIVVVVVAGGRAESPKMGRYALENYRDNTD